MNFIIFTVVVIGVIKPASAQDPKCTDPMMMNLDGNNITCPGKMGYFQCESKNSQQLNWVINDQPLGIFGAGNTMPRSMNTPSGIYNAYLVMASGGDLISILTYKVAPNFTGNVKITCSNELDKRCTKNVTAIGNDDVDHPTRMTNLTNDRNVTYSWKPSREAVKYRVTLKSDVLQRLEITTNTPSVTIPRIPDTVYYISVHAVNMCGAESPALEFKGREGPVDCTKKSAANKILSFPILLLMIVTFMLS